MASAGLDLLDQYRIATELQQGCTVHTFSRPDPARRSRRTQHTQEWSRVKQIGSGAFGVVYLEEEKQGELRAVKKVFKSGRERDDRDSLRELLSLATISKDNLNFPTFHGWYEDIEHIYIAMEYFSFGDLRNFSSHSTRNISEREGRLICFQISEALEAIHNLSITHRDLTPNNVFVVRGGPDWWIKLGDFGVSKRVRNGDTALHTILAGVYVAPEILGLVDAEDEADMIYTSAVDIWSLGCVAYWVLVGTDLFSPRSLRQYCRKACLPEDALSQLPTNEDCLNFVRRCLEMKPDKRPSVVEILDHPWLQDRYGETTLESFDGSHSQSPKPGGELGLELKLEALDVEDADKPDLEPDMIPSVVDYTEKIVDRASPIPEHPLPMVLANKDLTFPNDDPRTEPIRSGQKLYFYQESGPHLVLCGTTDGRSLSILKQNIGIPQYRNWRQRGEKHNTIGFLYECCFDKIKIRKVNGELMEVKYADLIHRDMRYVLAWMGGENPYFGLHGAYTPWLDWGDYHLFGVPSVYTVNGTECELLWFRNGLVKLIWARSLEDVSVEPVEHLSWQSIQGFTHAIAVLPEMEFKRYLFPSAREDYPHKFNTPYVEAHRNGNNTARNTMYGFNANAIFSESGQRAFWLLDEDQRGIFLACLKKLVHALRLCQELNPPVSRYPSVRISWIGLNKQEKLDLIVDVDAVSVFLLRGLNLASQKIDIAETTFLRSVQELDFETLKRTYTFRQWDRRGVDDELAKREHKGR